MQDTAASLGIALFQFTKTIGTQTKSKTEEVLVQNGIPEHLKKSFFTDYGQEPRSSGEKQLDEQPKHEIVLRGLDRCSIDTRIGLEKGL